LGETGLFGPMPVDVVPEPLSGFSIEHVAPVPFRIRRACTADSSDEIVVCGRRDQERYRLRPLPPPPLPERDAGLGIDLGPNARLSFGPFGGDLGQAAGLTLRIRF